MVIGESHPREVHLNSVEAYKPLHTSEEGPCIEAPMYGPSSDVWIAAFRCMGHPYIGAPMYGPTMCG